MGRVGVGITVGRVGVEAKVRVGSRFRESWGWKQD